MKFCIVGTGRCGTKLLGTTFHKHPDVAVFNESHWIPKMYEFFGEQRVCWRALLSIAERTTWVGGEPLLEVNYRQSIFDSYGEFHDTLNRELSLANKLDIREFSDILARVLFGEAMHWGDKTPDYGYYMGMLHQLWPMCRFIHLVRRPLATAHSMSKHPGFRLMVSSGHDNWCPLSFDHLYENLGISAPGIDKYLHYWRRRVNRIRDEAKRLPPGHYLELSYEGLLLNPRECIEAAARFVGVEPLDGWMAEIQETVDSGRLNSHFRHLSKDSGDF